MATSRTPCLSQVSLGALLTRAFVGPNMKAFRHLCFLFNGSCVDDSATKDFLNTPSNFPTLASVYNTTSPPQLIENKPKPGTMEVWHILITLGIVFFIIEIFTTGFISGSVGIGLIFAAIANYLGLDVKWQIVIFAFGVALTYFLIRPLFNKFGYRHKDLKTLFRSRAAPLKLMPQAIVQDLLRESCPS